MNEQSNKTLETGHYTGLGRPVPGLPSHFYWDPAQHERELKAIWYRNWLYVCRAAELAEARSFRTFEIGNQNILIVRDGEGLLHAFHNTCRHRGSVLCTEREGRFKASFIQCPYHRWTYSLRGELIGVPAIAPIEGLDKAKLPLYEVAVAEWGGFLFVNLAGAKARPFLDMLGPKAERLDNWPLADLVLGHSYRKTLACNWKVFWENFSECLHCPGLHPELSRLVPIYGRSIMGPFDDPAWASHGGDDDPRFRGGLRPGAVTWSMNGQATGAIFPDLTEQERRKGANYVSLPPSMFVVGHVDYVRIVWLKPLGPEETELSADWYFPAASLADKSFDLENAVGLARLVLDQDGAACELNQRGLRSAAHREGVLLPQEYAVHAFQNWVRQALSEA